MAPSGRTAEGRRCAKFFVDSFGDGAGAAEGGGWGGGLGAFFNGCEAG